MHFTAVLLSVMAGSSMIGLAMEPLVPRFRAVTVDTNVAIGYGVTVADVDGDGGPDIVLCDAKQIAWYRHPKWEKHVIAENLTPQDHVCVAAADIDGDGKAEIAVGAGWNPGDTVNSGALFYLEPPADPTARWTPIRLPHEPTMHRIRWVKDPQGWALWSVPLHGRGNKDGQGVGARVQRYRPPVDRRQPWTVETMADQWHKTHNFDPVVRSGAQAVTEVLVGSAEGVFRGVLAGAGGGGSGVAGGTVSWIQVGGPENGGVGEIRSLGNALGSVVGISPMHGNQLVIFHPPARGAGATTAAPGLGRREVLDDGLIDGHALACGDLLGIGQAQIVAGWRAMGRPRSVKVGVALYVPVGKRWMKVWVDDDGMACEDLTLADLDGDGRLDIIASGRSTHNLKVYFNESTR
ncbi:MAG: hypothetical protein RJB04_2439 [Verrucomicrobiota bacterium]|jgi:hypothetical protein